LVTAPLVVAPLAEPATMRTSGFVTETIIAADGGPHYVLRLYVTGATTRSARAISNIRKICEEHLEGRYDLEVVDISQHPTLAEGEQIIAAPTLIKKLPLPLRMFIGDMSQTDRILLGLDLRDTAAKQSPTGAG
jgi:circadian clock protein KaiB